MPARMHDAHFLAVVDRALRRCEPQTGLLGHGQRVHVRPDGHDRARPAAAQDPHHARVRDSQLHFQSELTQVRRHERSGLRFPIAELRIPMNDVTQLRGARGVMRDGLIEIGGVLCGRGNGGDEQGSEQGCRCTGAGHHALSVAGPWESRIVRPQPRLDKAHSRSGDV
jgi:hypothetical protein